MWSKKYIPLLAVKMMSKFIYTTYIHPELLSHGKDINAAKNLLSLCTESPVNRSAMNAKQDTQLEGKRALEEAEEEMLHILARTLPVLIPSPLPSHPFLPFSTFLYLSLSQFLSSSSFSSFLPPREEVDEQTAKPSQPGESWLELQRCCVGTEKPLLWFPCTKGAVPGTPDFPPEQWAGHGTSSQSVQS